MQSYLVVMLDKSGSMSDTFRSSMATYRSADEIAQRSSKMEEAKEQLLKYLRKSGMDIVTIIPFNESADHLFTATLSVQFPEIEAFIRTQSPGGGTNLSRALSVAIDIGLVAREDTRVQYLVITDGLSDNPEADLREVTRIPTTQGLFGILIDPTDDGEAHLSKLCKGRGSYNTVVGAHELVSALETHRQAQARYSAAAQKIDHLSERNKTLMSSLHEAQRQVRAYPELQRKLDPLLTESIAQASAIGDKGNQASEGIASHQADLANVHSVIEALGQEQDRLEELTKLLKECYQTPTSLKASVSHPRLLAMGHSSPFMVQFYPEDRRDEVDSRLQGLNIEFKKMGFTEQIFDTDLIVGRAVIVKLSSAEIEFSEEVTTTLREDITALHFTASPSESCRPGEQAIQLSVCDKSTAEEVESFLFKVEVVDYAFDHMSRPFTSGLASVVLGIGSFITYALSLMGQIDTTLGLASGTAAGALAAFLFARLASQYNRPTTTHP